MMQQSSHGRRPITIGLKRSHLRFEVFWCFMLPMLTIPRISLGGELLISDLALFFLVPIILYKHRRFNLRQPFLKQVLILLGLWILAAIVSDLRASSSTLDILRGQANLWMFAGYIFVFFVLIDGRRERYVAALFGIALAYIGKNLVEEGVSFGAFTGTRWKFGNGFAVTLIVLILLQSKLPTRKLQGGFAMAFSLMHLALNARSLFLTSFLSGATAAMGIGGLTRRARMLAGATLLAAAGILYPVAEGVYGRAVMSGTFGDAVRDKYIMQTSGDLGVLLGGRSEMLIAVRAVAQKPFLGFGSGLNDQGLRLEYFQLREAAGQEIRWGADFVRRSEIIPTHSFLFKSWVSHGILGAVFWIYVLSLLARGILDGMFGYRPAGPLEMLALLWTVWNVLFSPFGLTQRVFTAVFIVIAASLIVQNARRADTVPPQTSPERQGPVR